MSIHKRAKEAQLRGFLEMLREHTRGADSQLVVLMNLQDKGELVWTGKSPVPRRRKK